MKTGTAKASVLGWALALGALGAFSFPLWGQLKAKPAAAVTLPDRPRVVEFSAHPASVARGRTTLIRWKVEPGPGASPITSVQIVKTDGAGPGLDVRGTGPAGERELNVPVGAPEGRTTYALTAVNGAGLSAIKTLSLEITGPPDLVVKEIVSTGLTVGFSVTNIGRAPFRGALSFRVEVNGVPGTVAPDRFLEILKRAEGLYEVRDVQIPPGVISRFRLLDPESNDDAWYSGAYPITVRISTDDPIEDPRNNEKRITLNHTGIRRGTPTFDLYILGEIRLLAGGSSLWKDVRFTVFNTGPGDAADIEWEIRIADTEQVRRGEPGLRLKSGKIGRLGPGQTEVSFEQDLAIAVDKPMLLRVIVDPANRIFERDETNNKRELAFTLHRR